MSVTLYIKNATYKRDLSQLIEVCMEMEDKAIKPYFTKHNLQLDPYSMTSTRGEDMVVDVSQLSAIDAAQLTTTILTQLDLIGIAVMQVLIDGALIIFPFAHNPNVSNNPPDLNVCEGNKSVLFHMLLGLPRQEYPIEASVAQVKAALERPELRLLVPEVGRDDQTDQSGNCRVINCGLSEEHIKRYLARTKEIVDWAEQHQFNTLVVA